MAEKLPKPANRGRAGMGHPPFVPTPEQRAMVTAMVGVKLTYDEISLLIMNPSTGKHIDKETLMKRFPYELAVGRAKARATVGTKFWEKVAAGDNWALSFALRHINGWKDDNVAMTVNTDGVANETPRLTLEFVLPTQRPKDA